MSEKKEQAKWEIALELRVKAKLEKALQLKEKSLKIRAVCPEPISKIDQLLQLCCELIPTPIVNRIIQHYAVEIGIPLSFQNLVKVSNICYSSYYIKYEKIIRPSDNIIDDYSLDIRLLDRYHKQTEGKVDYGIIFLMGGYSNQYNESIKNHKKHKRYTAALIETIYFSLNNKDFNFKDFYILGELLIGMGVIDNAIKLYNIDERIFSEPNILSLLAGKAAQSGNLGDSIKLIGKLIEQEPFHPSIPVIQAEIKRLEQRHRLKTNFSIDFSKVDELSGVEFENLLMDKFLTLGFKVESTPNTGDFGADLIVENNKGSRIIVQCKRFKSKVNLKAVQEVVGAMGHYAGDMGIVITNNTFLNSAVKLAESHDIELWDGDRLVSFLAGDLSFSEAMNT